MLLVWRILMLNIKPKYLVNDKGRKTAVVLSMKEYRLLIEHLEEFRGHFRDGCRG